MSVSALHPVCSHFAQNKQLDHDDNVPSKSSHQNQDVPDDNFKAEA